MKNLLTTTSVILFLAIILLVVSCREKDTNDETSSSLNLDTPPWNFSPTTVTPANNSLIKDTTPIIIQFAETMDRSTLFLDGDMVTESDGGVWSDATADTLVISPNNYWSIGRDKKLDVYVANSEGYYPGLDLQYHIYRPLFPFNNSVIAEDQPIVVNFGRSMSTEALDMELGGDMLLDMTTQNYSWSSVNLPDDTLTFTPSGNWTEGYGKTLSIQIENNTLPELPTLNYWVSYSTFPTGPDKYEDDNNYFTAATFNLDEAPQIHTIWPMLDVDWVKVDLPSGTYEFSVDKLSVDGDSTIELYNSDGVTQTVLPNDNWPNSTVHSSRIEATLNGIYYLKISATNKEVFRYTLDIRTFTDSDDDGYSDHYDCGVASSNIYAYATEIAGDTIDQNCDGVDQLNDASSDQFEPDLANYNANTLIKSTGQISELIYRKDEIRLNQRTIYDDYETDYFKIMLEGQSKYRIGFLINNIVSGSPLITVYDETSELFGQNDVSFEFKNEGISDKLFFVMVQNAVTDATPGYYLLYAKSYGTDMDGDGFYSQELDTPDKFDCNDNDKEINPGAVETDGDSIDSNCDGYDNN